MTKQEFYIHICCLLADMTGKKGNFGVGSVIVDESKDKRVYTLLSDEYKNKMDTTLQEIGITRSDLSIVAIGFNTVVYPYFKSDGHAEMNAISNLEKELRSNKDYNRYLTLYTQLESCSMCMSRIAISGIKNVYYAIPDPKGGMSEKLCNLPKAFISMAQHQNHKQIEINNDLRELCHKVFERHYDYPTEIIKNRLDKNIFRKCE